MMGESVPEKNERSARVLLMVPMLRRFRRAADAPGFCEA